MTERLGNGPIDANLLDTMTSLADGINASINSDGKLRYGFLLMIYPFHGAPGRCNYISNTQREDVIVLLKEQLSRFEGMPDVTGNA